MLVSAVAGLCDRFREHGLRGYSAREVYYHGPLTPLNIVPTFDKGHVIVYDAGGVTVYAAGGSLACSVTAHAEGARMPTF